MMQGSLIKTKWYDKFKLNHSPHLKLYEGFGNFSHCTLMGHALSRSSLMRKKFESGFWHNAISLLRLFMVKPMAGVTVLVEWQDKVIATQTESDGFFILNLPNVAYQQSGNYPVKVQLLNPRTQQPIFEASTQIKIPATQQFSFISDIDDTFLISHSATLFKRMRVLLTRNAHSRRPFEGVVNHYKALQWAQTSPSNPNTFFYVSSSEWNLYDFIREFVQINKLPQGIYLLNQLKTISQLLKTGKNNHGTKFTRIVRILDAYPTQRFILLGDDSQQDPYIYEALCNHFAQLIHCVYIRQVGSKPKEKVRQILDGMTQKNIASCYFHHSSTAFDHSRKIGLIQQDYA